MSSRAARASTEGLEAPAASQAAGSEEESNSNPEPVKEPEPAAREPAPTPPPQQELSPDILHANVFLNELNHRLSGLDQAIDTLVAKRDGMVKRFNTAVAELKEKHIEEATETDRLIRDLQKTRFGALKGIEGLENYQEPILDDKEHTDDTTQS